MLTLRELSILGVTGFESLGGLLLLRLFDETLLLLLRRPCR